MFELAFGILLCDKMFDVYVVQKTASRQASCVLTGVHYSTMGFMDMAIA
jgi:hypothetical protein